MVTDISPVSPVSPVLTATPKTILETDRLILRELIPSDADGMFALDSDPLVHQYLGGTPITDINFIREVIEMVRAQYTRFGIGRWAVIEKSSGDFVGWAGLKWIHEPFLGRTQFYDVGYRLRPQFWNRGYATEATRASIRYGFRQLGAGALFAVIDSRNGASRRVLTKVGFHTCETQILPAFMDPFFGGGLSNTWFSLSRADWELSEKAISRDTNQ